MAARYHFLSTYRFEGDPERVWEVIQAVESWPQWWSWLNKVEVLRPGTTDIGLGAVYRYTVRAPAGYGFVYQTENVAVEPARRIDVVSSGEIVGRGRLAIESHSDGPLVVWFAWLVETPTLWMRILAPIARPMFTWNHDRMMDAFGAGLAKKADMRLLSSENSTIRPGAPDSGRCQRHQNEQEPGAVCGMTGCVERGCLRYQGADEDPGLIYCAPSVVSGRGGGG
jgi:hypothetical protein